MRLFKRLHESGRTVIVVTHDPQIAALAHRQIHLLDGRIVLDALTHEIRTPAPRPTPPRSRDRSRPRRRPRRAID